MHAYIPATQSGVVVNETGGPTLTGCTQHSVSLSLQEERGGEEAQSKQDRKREKRTEAEEDGAGGGALDAAHCHCYFPLQKMAFSIKPLMIPALCHGGVRDRDQTTD